MACSVLLHFETPRAGKSSRNLAPGGLPAGEIATRFNVSSPAISLHPKVLRRHGIAAQRRIYQLDPDGMLELEP